MYHHRRLKQPLYSNALRCYSISVGYADDKITLDWMNVTEPIQSTEIDQEENPIMVNDDVELPQFKVTGQSAERCKKRYHQKSGEPLKCTLRVCEISSYKTVLLCAYFCLYQYFPSYFMQLFYTFMGEEFALF